MSRSHKKKRKNRKSPQRPAAHPQDAKQDSCDPAQRRWLPGVVGVLIMLTGGVAYGLLTNRWFESTELHDAAARLQTIPKTIGEWESREVAIPSSQLEQAGAVGHLSRVYRNRRTNEEVQVFLICGRPGPISVHPPTVCFTGAGWALVEGPSKTTIDDDAEKPLGKFHDALFSRATPTGIIRQQTVWSWNATSEWQVPDNPRFTFAGSEYLTKLYVTTMLPSKPSSNSKATQEPDAGTKFMRVFLPALKQAGI